MGWPRSHMLGWCAGWLLPSSRSSGMSPEAVRSWIILIIIISLVACWKQHTKLVAIYFWSLLAHYIVDFGVLVANIVVAQKSAKRTIDDCQELIRQSGMTGDTGDLCQANNTNVIIFLTILGVCKLTATCMSLSWLFFCSVCLTSITQTRLL